MAAAGRFLSAFVVNRQLREGGACLVPFRPLCGGATYSCATVWYFSWVVFACVASRGNLWVTRINRFEDNIPQASPTQL